MNGLMSEENILEIAERITTRIKNPEDREDAQQEFALAVLEAQTKAVEGKGVRAYQWKCGQSKIKSFLKKSSEYSYYNRKSIDIHASMGDSEGTSLIDNVEGREMSPAAYLVKDAERANVRQKVETLPKTLRKIIKGRFFEGKTLQEVGKGLKLTRERVRQLEKVALEKLKFQF